MFFYHVLEPDWNRPLDGEAIPQPTGHELETCR
jgi:hypothetical protein